MRNRLTTIALVLALLLVACRPPARPSRCPFPEGYVEIGVILSESGAANAMSEDLLFGYELALAEINAQGGVLGCKIEVAFGDDQSDPAHTPQAVQTLAQESQALLIVGPPSGSSTMAAIGAADFYQIPFLVPSANDAWITAQGNEWVFALSASPSVHAAVALDQIEERLGREATIAIVYEGSLFGESGALPAAADAEMRGMRIVAYESFPAGALDSADLARLQQANGDVLYFVARPADAVALLEQYETLGINPSLTVGTTGGLADPDLLAAGERAEGTLLTVEWTDDGATPLAAEFAANFRAEYGFAPTALHAQSYTAFYVAREAIRLTGEQEDIDWEDIQAARLAVRDVLRGVDLETALGQIRFDSAGQSEPHVTVVQIVDGQYTTMWPEP